ncbi:MAG: M14 family zinc carboxypeptidase, partial [Candidatus Hodarchaeales archaeon]
SLGPYFNYSETYQKLKLANSTFPELVDLFSIGKSYEGRKLWTVRITDEQFTNNKTAIHVVGAHHAREAITVLNALYLMDKLLHGYINNEPPEPRLNKSSVFGNMINVHYGLSSNVIPIKSLLKRVEIYITPILNPDGLSIIHINPWQRKNTRPFDDDGDGNATVDYSLIRDLDNDNYINITSPWDNQDKDILEGATWELPGGVDLNRNYDAAFGGVGTSPHNYSEIYHGPEPFSEFETQAIRDFIQQHTFNYAISIHSGIKAIIDHNKINIKEGEELFKVILPITSYPGWNDIGGYPTTGDWGAYMNKKGIRSYTLETYGNYNPALESENATHNNLKGVFDWFNPALDSPLRLERNSNPTYRLTYFLALAPHIKKDTPTVNFQNIPANMTFYNTKKVNNDLSFNWWPIDEKNEELDRFHTDYDVKVFLGSTQYKMRPVITTEDKNISITLQDTDTLIKIAIYDGSDWTFSTFTIEDFLRQFTRETLPYSLETTPTDTLSDFQSSSIGSSVGKASNGVSFPLVILVTSLIAISIIRRLRKF